MVLKIFWCLFGSLLNQHKDGALGEKFRISQNVSQNMHLRAHGDPLSCAKRTLLTLREIPSSA
jgi:hypothetical protein